MNNMQPIHIRPSFVSAEVMTIPLQSINTFSTISTTNHFNTQCNEFVTNLRELTQRYNAKVKQALAADSNFRGSRSKGVK